MGGPSGVTSLSRGVRGGGGEGGGSRERGGGGEEEGEERGGGRGEGRGKERGSSVFPRRGCPT